jgi:predicted nucleotide-binding protein (sugar kinase/HSP70/actin superfamily)
MALDDLERRVHQVRPRELNRGTSKAMERGLSFIKSARTTEEIREARQAALAEVEAVPHCPGREALKVGIIGEIYVQLEPFANFDVEEILGNMGAEVKRSIFITQYAREDVFADGSKSIKKLARPTWILKSGATGRTVWGKWCIWPSRGMPGWCSWRPSPVSLKLWPRASCPA